MRNRWLALLIPAAAMLAFSATADAHGYGHKHGYKDSGYAPAYHAYGSRHHAPRHRGHRAPHYRGSRHAVYPPFHHPRTKYRYRGYRHGYKPRYGTRYRGYSPRNHHYRPHRGGITLHFGY